MYFKQIAVKGMCRLISILPIPQNEEIIVTCGMGYRGNIAASYLQDIGFQHVHSLAAGMKALKMQIMRSRCNPAV